MLAASFDDHSGVSNEAIKVIRVVEPKGIESIKAFRGRNTGARRRALPYILACMPKAQDVPHPDYTDPYLHAKRNISFMLANRFDDRVEVLKWRHG